ncbi:MAG: flavodoxin-dependent (E)-4-hydroxy-3-methylbut-2-enyl-diphosphate synthase [Deltaproteobacteria bacterium]|nr:flavodoxin-dependent (E)-4-hydroxy-3-methylbut-2-enyl-diphosphate synthase [Deltaproteobacteria bacterium]
MIPREKTRQISVGGVLIGGGAPIVVQSMTTTHPLDVASTMGEIERMERAGCELVRVAVPDKKAIRGLQQVVRSSPLPLIADVHFDHRLALLALEAGVDGLRINPGTIPHRDRLREIIVEASGRGVPIRIGINTGSLEGHILDRFGRATPEAMVESALECIKLCEDVGHRAIKVSLKASDVPRTVEAYRLFSQRSDYPLHLGVTEAGPPFSGVIKSAVALGVLLGEGIGDTIRVSLTGDPVLEVRAAYDILRALRIRERGVEIISCPTCGRCEVELIPLVEEVQERLEHIQTPLTVAVMGCVVNGPGEAKEADVGIAGGKGMGLLFKKGKVIEKVKEGEWVKRLVEEVERMIG